MSCKYCKLKRRKAGNVEWVAGEDWESDDNDGGCICPNEDDGFSMQVFYDSRYACTVVDDIKYCPFCGEKLTMIEEAGWEGVKKELRLEDENQRKAIKAWAKANDIAKFRVYTKTYYGWYCRAFSEGEPLIDIGFVGKMPECFEDGEEYTIEELNEEWEDYEPVEPHIKDEKVKKLLGEVVELELTINELNKRFVEFNKHYTELCGEEEE